MKVIKAGKPWEATARFAPAIVVETGPLLFTSGLVGRDANGVVVAKGDMGAQAHQAFTNLRDLLEQAGGTVRDIVKLTYFVTDMTRWNEVAAARSALLGDAILPASTTVEVTRLWDEDCIIELEAVAQLRAEQGRPGDE